ncbi:MAG: beta-L-arabinofuranosidase domain-containing protein [Anaerolineae bacterium]
MEYGLKPVAFRPLPLGRVRPLGWLERQLRIQAEGISGHLDEFWPDVKDSRWFGGDAEAWERAPYWLDGFIPLAFVLDDAVLKAKVTRYMDYILTHQHEDGWLGPREMIAATGRPEDARYDLWAQLLAMKVLVQYHDATGDERAVEAVEKCLRCLDRHIDTAPLFNWGQFRWFEGLIAIFWLYEKTGETWLLDLAVKLRAQGFDWRGFFARWPITAPTPKHRWNYMGHVVNNAMAIKAYGLWHRLTGVDMGDRNPPPGTGAVSAGGDTGDRAAVYDMIEKLDRYHGMVTGVFTGDECLAGKQPTHGTELCAVVEYAYSLEVLLSVLGDLAFADRLEKIIFNALPATFSPDMWSHQYDQQVNQVECSVVENRIWNTNGPASNTFGVEPNYGCCTANLSQGWPKFAAHLWMTPVVYCGETATPGLAAVAYAPSRVETEIEGVPVTVTLETDYPFRDILRFIVTVERPVRFSLWMRIPEWTPAPGLRVDGRTMIAPTPGTYHEFNHLWQGTTTVDLWLPMTPALWRGHNDAVALTRGPLVYALKIGEDWRRINEDQPYRELPHADWEVYPMTPWNYALAVDEATLFEDVTFTEFPVGEMPFSPQGAPVEATVKGRRLPEWGMDHGSAADAPQSPVTSDEPLETLTLIPYGCTNLRITEFPVLKR